MYMDDYVTAEMIKANLTQDRHLRLVEKITTGLLAGQLILGKKMFLTYLVNKIAGKSWASPNENIWMKIEAQRKAVNAQDRHIKKYVHVCHLTECVCTIVT